MEDAALIRLAQRGDAASLSRLLQANYLSVKKYLVTVTLDRTLAEDLTQETMIRAIQKIGQFSGRSKFSTWLIAIATHLYMDVLRSRRRERRVQAEALEVLLPEGDGPGPEWQDMMERLADLPRDVAMPLVLKHYHGYTYEEIAEWMHIPVGTVKSRIFNGIRSLRKELTDDEA
ncbi:MAG TPA: RNA polymerase sigma factor SigY [Symbiobacteriaceae bacterium]|jgi:RNA polymerase sigma-70 factor (ECF subfamily)